jgi:hypothetical protein
MENFLSNIPPLPPSLYLFEENSNYLQPPCPPCEETKQSQMDFDYLPESSREFVQDAYEVISKNEWWQPFREALLSRGVDSTSGFMFTNDPLYRFIMQAICDTNIGSLHSGFSIAYVMREMKFIALNGEDEYKKLRRPKQ